MQANRVARSLLVLIGVVCGTAVAAAQSDRVDVADRQCRVVLRAAKIVSADRVQCRLEASIDVRIDFPDVAPRLVVHRVGSGSYLPTAALLANGYFGRFVRYSTEGLAGEGVVFSCDPIELIAVLEVGNTSYFDHNDLGGDFGMRRVADEYVATTDICAL